MLSQNINIYYNIILTSYLVNPEMLKRLVILFVTKLYSRINIYIYISKNYFSSKYKPEYIKIFTFIILFDARVSPTSRLDE